MNGAEYITHFLFERGVRQVFAVLGGACAFIVDAIARHGGMSYICFQHEQAAAMAADAVWRASGVPGVTLVTSGPGATNLLTGIGCSYFDSIPSIHITGQVNAAENAVYAGTSVRQRGFQETDIVQIARPLTKFATRVSDTGELQDALVKAYSIATTSRMGPVLIDVPMDIQQAEVVPRPVSIPSRGPPTQASIDSEREALLRVMDSGERPLILVGGGVGLADQGNACAEAIRRIGVPCVASWSGVGSVDDSSPLYLGTIGIYGDRSANAAIQNCDRLLVLGSRLDGRQRSSRLDTFAPLAKVHVVDIDFEELKKHSEPRYSTARLDLSNLSALLEGIGTLSMSTEWLRYIGEIRERYSRPPEPPATDGGLCPYAALKALDRLIPPECSIVFDVGGTQCLIYQCWRPKGRLFFTSCGMAPMGYGLPAAIGVSLSKPGVPVVCVVGDGGFQMNIQELQTVAHHKLDLKVVILNNDGYGILKQFQESNFAGRMEASGKGYSCPDFQQVVEAYAIPCAKIRRLGELSEGFFREKGPRAIELVIDPASRIQGKVEPGRPINVQSPLLSAEEFRWLNRFLVETEAGRSVFEQAYPS